ncbi:MAG TPA: hypothetical protein VJ506_06705 [Candidatus Limnocylindrales bacterium]|nr:hypothetical protein [Candidatus Limnocylindrales bacterium]
MAGLRRLLLSQAEPGFTLPVFERLAPPPPPGLLAARLEANSAPGDIVADLHGRGAWVARVAIDRQRRAFSLEVSPLTRLLAEVVLRPPDLRHLDAAFNGLGASPRGESSLKLSIGELFATRCATCGRATVAEELVWSARGEDGGGAAGGHGAARAPGEGASSEGAPSEGADGPGGEAEEPGPAAEADQTRAAVPTRKHYRCTVCRDQQGGGEYRTAEPDEADLRRARREVGGATARRRLRERFPMPEGGDGLIKAILGLHTDRQLVGLLAILDRIEGDLRAAPVESALRLAFLHAVLPASRLGAGPGRVPALKIAAGVIKTPMPDPWRERNPWLAFEDGYRTVRGFVQRLESGALGPLEARLGTDLGSLVEGPATAVLRVATPTALETLAEEAREPSREPGTSVPARARIRLVLGQPPARFSQERLAAAYHGTAWALGREAAALLPLEPLLGPAIRAPWSWQAATLRRSLEAAAPHMARDGRVVLVLESGGPEALVAAVLGGVGAGYRLVDARLAEPDENVGGIVELVPPGGILPPPARSRGNQALEPGPGGRGDPDLIPGPGLFAPPERIDARPFSALEAARSITETAVEVLRARGEPARYGRLLGEILVGLDRSGQLRRLVASEGRWAPETPGGAPSRNVRARTQGASRWAGGEARAARAAIGAAARTLEPGADPVERVLHLVHDELSRPGQRRVVEIEPGRWWLGDRADRQAAAVPLADRVEWAVYSLLSTAGPIGEAAFFERIAALFVGHDLPDEALVRACLASYRSPASTPDHLLTGEDLRTRTLDHTELLALLANGGHRAGLSVWLGRREQARRIGERTLAEYLDRRERDPWLPSVLNGPVEDVEAVDCIWYARGRLAIVFEVEWTAMLGDLLLRRHARLASDPSVVRFLVLAPERADLARHKLEASPVLRGAIESGNWHVLLWPQLRAWLGRETVDLAVLEPYLGLDPAIQRRGEQLNLFDRPDPLP